MILGAAFFTLGTLSGCNGGSATVPSSTTTPLTVDTDVPTVPVTETQEPTGDTGTPTTGPTGDTGTVPDPCLSLAAAPLSSGIMSGTYPSTEEFHFDALGHLWNASDGDDALFRTTLGGAPDFFAPYSVQEAAGTRVLPDGSGIAVCNEWTGSIDRIDLTTGSQTVILGGIDSPNSIGFDNRGFLYIAAYGSILRYPLAGGPIEVLFDQPWYDFDGITFSPTFDRVYFNHDEGGTVGYVEMEADGTVITVGELAQINQAGGWPAELDGATADSCGNVYVISTSGDLYRVDTAGNVIRYYQAPGYNWTTSVNFGSGVGGWERDHIYIMERYQGIIDLEVGVDGYAEPHYP